jgi:WbqC-like protein family
MKLALMQPYLFPYIGYFQLLAQVDRFVFYDDVNFIKNGWINRNRLLLHGEPRYFTVPLRDASPFRKIRDVEVAAATGWRRTIRESIRHAYGKAAHFAAVAALVERVLETETTRIGELAKASVRAVVDHLGLGTELVDSSGRYGNESLSGAARVVDICRREGASDYYNAPGGRSLYDADEFARHGIALHFVAPEAIEYRQGGAAFVPGLSIIDVLMHNDAAQTRELLRRCTVS